jgi:hypothetical protein
MKTPNTWSQSSVVVWPTFSSIGFTHGQCGVNHLLSHKQKQPNFRNFLNQYENNNKSNPKSWLWNKKKKNKNTTHVKQKSNIIFLQGRNKNKTRLWQENVPKTGVEQTKGNREFYLYLYPLGT